LPILIAGPVWAPAIILARSINVTRAVAFTRPVIVASCLSFSGAVALDRRSALTNLHATAISDESPAAAAPAPAT
jgi:hypothetical protein